MFTCPNGHPNPEQAKFCSICGVVLQQQVAPMSPSPSGQRSVSAASVSDTSSTGSTGSTEALNPASQTPSDNNRSKKILGLSVGGSIVGLIVLALIVVVIRGGGQNFEPMTAIQAERALLTASELNLNLVRDNDDGSVEENKAYDPDLSRDCTVIAGVRRLTDLPPSFRLGAPAFPNEAKNITVFEGIDFKNPESGVVTTLDERIIVFPTLEDASTYVDDIEQALAACPRSNRGSSGTTISYQLEERYDNILRTDDGRTLTYDISITFESESTSGLIDISFSSQSKVMVVQRGPNVMIGNWYLDDRDRLTPGELDAELGMMRDKFIDAASKN